MKNLTLTALVLAVSACAADSSTALTTELELAIATSDFRGDAVVTVLTDVDTGAELDTAIYNPGDLPDFERAAPDGADPIELALRYANALTYERFAGPTGLDREVAYEAMSCSDLGEGCEYCADSDAWCVFCSEGGTEDGFCAVW